MTTKIKEQDQITKIDISQLHSSELNSRKSFKQESIDELAKSICENGLIQPITVRLRTSVTNPDKSIWYEIIAGERRFRALKVAILEKPELKDVLCIVRDYTDEEAEAVQIAENIHREDLSPMEECEAYNKLYKHHKTILRVAEIAGKSENYVSSRMQLSTLHKQLQKFLKDGSLPIAHALIFAKYPEELQKNMMENYRIMNYERSGKGEITGINELVSVKKLIKAIADEYNVPLNSAIFNLEDANLDSKAGPCTKCKFNTGLNKSLFEDVTNESMCIKGSCFKSKTWKSIENRVKQLKTSGEKFLLLWEDEYEYQSHNGKDYKGYKTVSSWPYKISKQKSADAILGIILDPKYNSKYSVGEEVYLTEKPKKELKTSPNSGRVVAPPDESPLEMRERRMTSKFAKQDELDKIEVRKQIVKKIITDQKFLSSTMLQEAIQEIVAGIKSNNLLVFRHYGIEVDESKPTGNLDKWNVDEKDWKKLYTKIKTEADLLVLIRVCMAYRDLNLFKVQEVNLTNAEDDYLIQYAKEYKIDVNALHKPLVESRKKEREIELADLQAAKARAKEKEKKEKAEAKAKGKSSSKKKGEE